jgi:hypothetical protein
MAGSGVETETVKMEVDYSAEVERLIPECETVAMEGRLSEALDKLLLMEKQTRTVRWYDHDTIYESERPLLGWGC